MGGSATISTSETRAEALTLQSSSYGVTKAVVHGTARLSGNLVDYLNFRAIPRTTRTSSGGKGGGGVRSQNTTYTYAATLVMAVCEGPIIDITKVWRGKVVYTGISAPAQVGASVIQGAEDQAVWSPLTTLAGGAHAINYSGLALVAAQDYDLGSSAAVENHAFEVVAGGRFVVGGAYTADADPSVILTDWLTNTRWGARMASAKIGDLSIYSTYCKAAGLLLSPALTEQAAASERVRTLSDLTNSWAVRMDGKIYMVPLGDDDLTGNGATYTPDTTPVYHLTRDHFLPAAGAPAVRIRRRTPADAYNSVKVQYRDRAHDYNAAVATDQDLASIEAYGLRQAPTLQADWVRDATVADKVAQIRSRRFRYVLNEYQFTVPWNFARLVPSSIVTISDEYENLDKVPVRIKTIEDVEGGYDITAEDYPHSVSAVASYALQGLNGYRNDYNVAPGAASTPVFIEPPVELTSTGLEVWIAATGLGQYWGGCHVWVSMSGTNYKRLGTIYRGARYGQLSEAFAANGSVMKVALTDTTAQLLNATAADALALNTLCFVRDTVSAEPELISYTTATLTGAGAYTLGGLVRGAYGTSPVAHVNGAQFVRLDEAVVRSDPLQPDQVGKTLHVKLQSFNVFGFGVEDLANVTEHTYVITGAMLNLPPSDVGGLTAAMTTGGVLVRWARGSGVQYLSTEVRYIAGTTANWSSGTLIATVDADSVLWTWPALGTYTVMARHIDAFGAVSQNITNVQITVTAGGIRVGTEQVGTAAVTEIMVADGYAVYTNAL